MIIDVRCVIRERCVEEDVMQSLVMCRELRGIGGYWPMK